MWRMILIALLMSFVSVTANGQEQQAPASTPPQVAQAKEIHDAAIKQAQDAYHQALIATDQQYIADLDAALKDAMKNMDIDSARALDDQKKAAIAILKRDQGDLEAAGFSKSIGDIAIVGPAVQEQNTSLDLKDGASVYIYGVDTGGGRSSNDLNSGSKVPIKNSQGNLCAELAVSLQPHNEFSTDCAYYCIGGLAAKGHRFLQAVYASDNQPGVSSVQIKFTLRAPAVVAVMALAAAQSAIQLDGPDQLVIDAHGPNDAGSLPLTIGHAVLQAGDYVLTERSSFVGSDTQQANRGDLMGLFVFSQTPDVLVSDSPALQLPAELATAVQKDDR